MDIQAVINGLGLRPAVKLPEGVAFGTFRFDGTLDYDAATADSTVIDFTTSAAQVDKYMQSVLKTENDAEISMHIEAIRVVLSDADLQVDTQETLHKLFGDLYLYIEQVGQPVLRIPVYDACGLPWDTAGVEDTNTTTAVQGVAAGAQTLVLAWPIQVDLKKVTTFKLAAGTVATGSILGADSAVSAFLTGIAWDSKQYDPAKGGHIDCSQSPNNLAKAFAPRVPGPAFPALTPVNGRTRF